VPEEGPEDHVRSDSAEGSALVGVRGEDDEAMICHTDLANLILLPLDLGKQGINIIVEAV